MSIFIFTSSQVFLFLSLIFLFPVSSLSTFVSTTTHASASCLTKCRFKFCDGTSTLFLLASQDVAVSPAICTAGNARLVSISQTGEAKTPIRRALRNISTLPAAQPFSPSFFKPLPLSQGVGLAHETPQQNQLLVANKRCFLLPIRAFQVQRKLLIQNEVGTKKRDCIAFKAVLPHIVVELVWDSPDDLDLVVIDPRREELSAFQGKKTKTGMLLNDDGVSTCSDSSQNGREVSIYRGKIRRGTYVAYAKHWENCGRGAAWTLNIMVRGKVVKTKNGFSRGDGDQLVIGSLVEFDV